MRHTFSSSGYMHLLQAYELAIRLRREHPGMVSVVCFNYEAIVHTYDELDILFCARLPQLGYTGYYVVLYDQDDEFVYLYESHDEYQGGREWQSDR